jgi:hypothetical protein
MSTAAVAAGTSRRAGRSPPSNLTLPVAGAVIALLVMIVGALLAWRRDEQLPTIYGRRRGGEAGRSVNGTAVLAELFRRAGHRVTTMNRLSPKVHNFDVIVWVPDDFQPPTKEQREWLQNWLNEGFKKTVVYVGRDYDAAIDYWNRVAAEAPPHLADEAEHRRAEARAALEAARSKMPKHEDADWFTVLRDQKPCNIENLRGPWADGIDAKKTAIHLEGRLAIPTEAQASADDRKQRFEVLLGSEDDALVTRVTNDEAFGGGQVILIANGSLVLNYPLVNHEHRKLAARLVEECEPGERVVFIESGAGGPKILAKEPTGGFPTALELLKVWPLNAILLHVTLLGIVLCLARSPIFGRPRELPPDSPSDFGKHVAALGKLLARSKDRNYALARLSHYRQISQRRSGRSHLKKQ